MDNKSALKGLWLVSRVTLLFYILGTLMYRWNDWNQALQIWRQTNHG